MHDNPLQNIFSPPELQDEFSRELVSNPDYGLIGAKRLKDGTYCGLVRLITTIAICVDVTPYSAYTRRYCYRDLSACLAAYAALEDGNSIPEGWDACRPAN